MTPDSWIAIAGIVVTILIVLITAFVAHIRHDEQRESRIKQIEQEIGTHETGLRGEMHRQVNLISRLRAIVYFIGKKLDIDVMKDMDDK